MNAEQADQQFESDWWGDCCVTYGEETKQLTYARLMNLGWEEEDGRWPTFLAHGKTVLDIGGGPVSLLLKCVGLGPSHVADPCDFPVWTLGRYATHGVDVMPVNAETLDLPSYEKAWDEVWIYNVLQHVRDPEKVCANALWCARERVRIFEWLETPPHLGHPHTLHADDLDEWLGCKGRVLRLHGENGCTGISYSAVKEVRG